MGGSTQLWRHRPHLVPMHAGSLTLSHKAQRECNSLGPGEDCLLGKVSFNKSLLTYVFKNFNPYDGVPFS
jgi:hypothetical protein